MTEVVPLSLKNSEAGPVSVVKLGPLNNSEDGRLKEVDPLNNSEGDCPDEVDPLNNSEVGRRNVVGPLNNSEVGPLSLNKVTQMVSTTRPRISIKYHLLQFMIITTIKGF